MLQFKLCDDLNIKKWFTIRVTTTRKMFENAVFVHFWQSYSRNLFYVRCCKKKKKLSLIIVVYVPQHEKRNRK